VFSNRFEDEDRFFPLGEVPKKIETLFFSITQLFFCCRVDLAFNSLPFALHPIPPNGTPPIVYQVRRSTRFALPSYPSTTLCAPLRQTPPDGSIEYFSLF